MSFEPGSSSGKIPFAGIDGFGPDLSVSFKLFQELTKETIGKRHDFQRAGVHMNEFLVMTIMDFKDKLSCTHILRGRPVPLNTFSSHQSRPLAVFDS